MKKKQKKARKVKIQKELDKISCGSAKSFPKQLTREDLFKSSTKAGSSANQIGHLKISSLCSCLG